MKVGASCRTLKLNHNFRHGWVWKFKDQRMCSSRNPKWKRCSSYFLTRMASLTANSFRSSKLRMLQFGGYEALGLSVMIRAVGLCWMTMGRRIPQHFWCHRSDHRLSPPTLWKATLTMILWRFNKLAPRLWRRIFRRTSPELLSIFLSVGTSV